MLLIDPLLSDGLDDLKAIVLLKDFLFSRISSGEILTPTVKPRPSGSFLPTIYSEGDNFPSFIIAYTK